MASLNNCQFIGNVGKAPELRYLSNGDAVCNFSIAINENWKDQNGDRKESTEWVNVVAYKKLAEICGEYLSSGKQVYVQGKLKTRKWTDKAGVERYSTDIIASDLKMLGSKPSGDREEKKFEGGAATSSYKPDFSDMSDDIPFLNNNL